jgi:hypothetical protein
LNGVIIPFGIIIIILIGIFSIRRLLWKRSWDWPSPQEMGLAA